MAQSGFGVSFLPGGDASYTRPTSGNASPIQEAIKVLSLRVPRVVGSTPLTPLALLTGQGGGGLPSGLVETLLRSLTPPAGTPPVASVPTQQTQGQAPSMGLGTAPQPVQPSILGAPSPMAGAPAAAPQGFSAPPTVSVTAGVKEPSSDQTYTPPAQPPIPDPSLTRQGDQSAQDLYDLSRRMRGRMA
jgi:hypothetical protein